MSWLSWIMRLFRRKPKPLPQSPPGTGISLLVPFRAPPGSDRERSWTWLRDYWKHELPGAEIIVGTNSQVPFSKTAAVNDAASRATGDIYVVLDADAYLYGAQITKAADEIREARAEGRKLWLIPYRHLYRMTHTATELVLSSDPAHPLRFSSPPPRRSYSENGPYGDNTPGRGHWFAAMAIVLPKEAFERVGGLDGRMSGWGFDDVAVMRALDTLYGKHKTLKGDILHLWHPIVYARKNVKMWPGQENPLMSQKLAERYYGATGNPAVMQQLLDEREWDNPLP